MANVSQAVRAGESMGYKLMKTPMRARRIEEPPTTALGPEMTLAHTAIHSETAMIIRVLDRKNRTFKYLNTRAPLLGWVLG